MAAICLAAGPVSRQAAPPELTPGEIREAIEKEKISVIKRLESTSAYAIGMADVKAKDEALQSARKQGSLEDKIAASTSFNRAREKVATMRKTAIKNDLVLATLAETLIRATKRAEAAEAKAATERAEEEKRVEIERIQRPFVERMTKITSLKKEFQNQKTEEEEKDPYVLYAHRTRIVIEAIKTAMDFPGDSPNERSPDEYGQLAIGVLQTTKIWKDLNFQGEKNYPSALRILKVSEKIARDAQAFVFEHEAREDYRKQKAKNADPEVLVIATDTILKMAISRADFHDGIKTDLDAIAALLNSREGTRPSVPPPPPK